MIGLTGEPEFVNEWALQHDDGIIGLIYLDTVDYAGLERSRGRMYCDKLLHSAKAFLQGLKRELPSISSVRQVGDDLFVLVRLPVESRETGPALLNQMTLDIRKKLENQLRETVGGTEAVIVYSGSSLLAETDSKQGNHLLYNAMKQSIRRVALPANLEEDRSRWSEFLTILNDRGITSVYQPILSLSDAAVFGFEALTRGPEESHFHSPLALFEYAERHGALYSLDKLARETAIEGCVGLRKEQRVFINIPAAIINDPQFTPGTTMKTLEKCGIHPHNVVLEITERTSIEDFSTAKRILQHYRSQGYQIAIDDAGAGYSSLQAIAELQPDFIKVDRSLIQNIHRDRMKETILETFVSFARKMSIRLIAEGIENWEELKKLSQMGVHYGQGYLLGRPLPGLQYPSRDISENIERINRIEGMDSIMQIGNLATSIRNFEHTTPISEVANYFKQNEDASGTVILNQQQPVGLVMRERLFQQLAGQYGISLYWNRPIHQLMDKTPLVVEETVPIEQVSQMAMSREKQRLYDLIIITSKEKMMGVTSIQALLEAITNVRMECARVANPLTGLPGNLQINREMNKRIFDGKPFSVVYADLDYFKWFNDRYGFQRGDQLIQYTADVLQQAISVCGHPHDFVGHIGGDDFIVISGTEDPRILCREIIRRFDQGVGLFYEGEDLRYVMDRQGNKVDAQGVSISLSLVICECGDRTTLEQISNTAAALKKQAKAHGGSFMVSTVLHTCVTPDGSIGAC